MKNKKIQSIAFSALFTALICILSQVSFLTPSVPITLQIFAVALCGYTLSLKWSAACVGTYIAIGSLGLPVFSAFRGGMQIILGPTGGFIFGFIILAAACSLTEKVQRLSLKVLFSAAGLIICHIFGTVQYSIVTGTPLGFSFLTASLPFIWKDIVLLIAAFFTAKLIKNRIKGLKF